MAWDEKTVFILTCDGGCGMVERCDKHKLPLGWTDTTHAPFGPHNTIAIDLCPECSKNPEDAKRKYISTHS